MWYPVRIGLGMVFWGLAAILAISGLFTAFWFGSIFLFKIDIDIIRALRVAASGLVLLALLACFVGLCFCIRVPTDARARRFVVLSVLFSALTALAVIAVLTVVPAEAQPSLDKAAAGAEAPMPEAENPKAPPQPEEPAPKAEQPAEAVPNAEPMPGEALPKTEPLLPRVAVPKLAKILVLAAYFAAQVLFILFLKRVALYFNDIFLADSTSGYLSLLLFHTVLLALLPPEAMTACFFWVIMLALQFILMAWLLILLTGIRKAVA